MNDLSVFTLVHIALSLLGMVAGLVLVGGFVAGVRLNGWGAVFLVATVLTNLTGFGFPFTKVLPSHLVGALSLLVLALCLWARYGKRLAGRWHTVYLLTAVLALFLNVFVLVAQLFTKTPALQQLAPTQSEPPFALAQALLLVLFIGLGRAALRGMRQARR